jgi:hypothetical protein
MSGSEMIETIGWALFGGLVAEFIGIFELRHKVLADLPYWFRSKFYWASVLGMIVVGGVLALAYLRAGMNLNALLAINVGASAPLALRQAISNVPRHVPSPDPLRVD